MRCWHTTNRGIHDVGTTTVAGQRGSGDVIAAIVVACVGLLATVAGSRALAQQPAPPSFPAAERAPSEQSPDSGIERHDGLMLRFTLGVGYTSATEAVVLSDGSKGDLELSGVAGFFTVDLGGSFVDNLVLHARISDFANVAPSVSLGGVEGNANDASLLFYVFGAAATYYFMPLNAYATFALGPAYGQFDSGNGDTGSTDIGVGLNFDVGGEAWVSENWGLGPAVRFFYASVPDSDTLSTWGIGILFSATYQ